MFSTDPPMINITKGSSYLTTVGENLTITCKAEGLPTPTVQWYKNDTVIKDSANVSVQELNVITTFPHTAVYTCVARNYLNTTNENVTVTVQGIICDCD